MDYHGNQPNWKGENPANAIKLAKSNQLLWIRMSRVGGAITGPLTLYSTGVTAHQYFEGDISGLRVGYRYSAAAISFAGPPGWAVG